MTRTLVTVAAALSLFIPFVLARPTDVLAAGKCGIAPFSGGPEVSVSGDVHLYSYVLTSPCALPYDVLATYNTRTKVAGESLSDNGVASLPHAYGQWICTDDP